MRNNPYSPLSLIPKYFNDYKTAYNFCISCKLGYILGYKKFRLEYDKLGYKNCAKKNIDILLNACSKGHLDKLKYIKYRFNEPIFLYMDVLYLGVYFPDRLDILKWWCKNSSIHEIYSLFIFIEAESHSIYDIIKNYDEHNCLKYLYDILLKIENLLSRRENIKLINNFKFIVFLFACAKNQLHFIKYFAEENKNINFNMIITACQTNSNISIIKWLYENTKENYGNNAIISYNMIDAACCNNVYYCSYNSDNTLEIVKWLHENVKQNCTTYAMDYASSNGKLEVVKFLHENRTEGCTTNAIDWASMNGHLEVVKFLHENRTEGCTKNAIDYACKNGHFEIVKYLCQIGAAGYMKYPIFFMMLYLRMLIRHINNYIGNLYTYYL